MLTLEEFVATKVAVDDLRVIEGYRDNMEDRVERGLVYQGETVIEGPYSGKYEGQYQIIIGNHCQMTTDLATLERQLYEYALVERDDAMRGPPAPYSGPTSLPTRAAGA